jgi:hypothetical protein
LRPRRRVSSSDATRRGKGSRKGRREAAEQARRKQRNACLDSPACIHDGVGGSGGSGPLQKHPSHRPRGDVARRYWPRQRTRDRGAGLGGRKRQSNEAPSQAARGRCDPPAPAGQRAGKIRIFLAEREGGGGGAAAVIDEN